MLRLSRAGFGHCKGVAVRPPVGVPEGVSLHTLHHSHGSHLLSNGVPLPAVSKRLSHANMHITATVYSHALEKDEQASAEAWEIAIGDIGRKPNANPW